MSRIMSTCPVTARPTRHVSPTTPPRRLRIAEMRCSVPAMPARLSLPKVPSAAAAPSSSSRVTWGWMQGGVSEVVNGRGLQIVLLGQQQHSLRRRKQQAASRKPRDCTATQRRTHMISNGSTQDSKGGISPAPLPGTHTCPPGSAPRGGGPGRGRSGGSKGGGRWRWGGGVSAGCCGADCCEVLRC